MTTTLNQKRNSSFLLSLILFIATSSLLLTFLYLGKKHYQQSEDEAEDSKFSREIFEPLPDDELPPPKKKEEKEKLSEPSPQEILERLAKQKQWKKEILPQLLSDKTKREISNFLDFFYRGFFKTGLNSYERKWKREFIRPKKVNGRLTTKKTLTRDIKECKKIFPEIEKEAEPNWTKFAGWLSEEEKENNNTVLLGLCENKTITSRKRHGSTLCYLSNRQISIKLKPELFFFDYDPSWIEKIDPKNPKPQLIKTGWEEIIETIAHELAHAVINTILVDEKVAKLNKEGHGNLHDDFTERIKGMIRTSGEYNKFQKYIDSLDKTQ